MYIHVHVHICMEIMESIIWPRRGRSCDRNEGARGKERGGLKGETHYILNVLAERLVPCIVAVLV